MVCKVENVYTSDKCRTPKIKGMLICSDEILPLITVNKREKVLNIKYNPPKNINSSSADRATKMNLMEALKHARDGDWMAGDDEKASNCL